MDAIRTLKPEVQKEILTTAVQNNLGYDDIKATFADVFDNQEPSKNSLSCMVSVNSHVLPDAWEELYPLVLQVVEKMLSLTHGKRKECLQVAFSALQDAKEE
jgi:hypothetical protein